MGKLFIDLYQWEWKKHGTKAQYRQADIINTHVYRTNVYTFTSLPQITCLQVTFFF